MFSLKFETRKLAKVAATAFENIDHFPLCSRITPPLCSVPELKQIRDILTAQELAQACIQNIATQLQPGISEKETARLIRLNLRDVGVGDYFHRPLVFFGDRTRYDGITHLKGLAPTDRSLAVNDVYILDVGPVVNGVACDVSLSGVLGSVPGYDEARKTLLDIRRQIPQLVASLNFDGAQVWESVKAMIESAGFEAVHHTSPFSFFGHRLNGTRDFPLARKLAERGKQTFAEFFARGLSGQLWSKKRRASLYGIWAVEPHIGFGSYGVKFEEALVVGPDGASWLVDTHH